MDLHEAKAVALDILAHEQKSCKFKLALFDVITEKPYGWLFGYESEAYVRTGNPRVAAFGTMGFLILKKTGPSSGSRLPTIPSTSSRNLSRRSPRRERKP